MHDWRDASDVSVWRTRVVTRRVVQRRCLRCKVWERPLTAALECGRWPVETRG